MNATGNGVLLVEASQRVSPNQDLRPADCVVDLLVIHNISLPPGRFGGPWIDDLFHNRLDPGEHPYFTDICQRRVSSHLLIRRDGELLQYVPLCRRAWHAGESCFEGKTACNDFSIGIELEGTDDIPYTDPQYLSLVHATKSIMSIFPGITRERITGHSDIAPGRKTDPGPAFDWMRYLNGLD
ncbi:MAG: 1,6-anhydro-N-acetylmuramyl-L-alanine amidase AmpD [Gammaproteobacteria bacterium]|nr:1,6-anhydro-N-acetylmuramyl-L-alanine amidase AmpD [Gammaproteobacteria bacterium]HXK55429.1 1,6-anhydro-N-acetylmuramyl-L-alanine amidase AmpD [Gammaproteobacteria bacterium]